MIGLLQTASGYSQTVAQSVGALMVLGVVAYWFASRRTGRDGSEWNHEKQIGDELGKLPRTPVANAADEDELEMFLSDMDYLTGQTDVGPRRVRVKRWLERLTSPGVAAHGCPITDADGRTIHLASVAGVRLAHRDQQALLEDIKTVAEARLGGERTPATFSEYYAEDIERGFVDINGTQSRVRGDCKTRIQDNMQREGELPKQELIETFVYDSGFRYPEPVVEEKLAELISRDIRQHKDGRLEWQRF